MKKKQIIKIDGKKVATIHGEPDLDLIATFFLGVVNKTDNKKEGIKHAN